MSHDQPNLFSESTWRFLVFPNIENLTKLLNWLEAGAPHAHFNMSVGLVPQITVQYTNRYDVPPSTDCKTACCLAGAAVLLSNPDNLPPPSAYTSTGEANFEKVYKTAKTWLGLDDETAIELFEPDHKDYIDITLGEATQAVRNVILNIPAHQIWED